MGARVEPHLSQQKGQSSLLNHERGGEPCLVVPRSTGSVRRRGRRGAWSVSEAVWLGMWHSSQPEEIRASTREAPFRRGAGD